ncbi:MAG: DUF4421 family protein [Chitinophagales bacterium]
MAVLIIADRQKVLSQILFENKPVDSNYINKQASKWSARVYAVSKENRFYMFNTNWSDRVSFFPETKIATGIGVSYNNLALDLGITVLTQSEITDQKTTGLNFIGAIYNKQHVADIMLQVNKGYVAVGPDDSKTLRNDIRVFNFGINYDYLFNYTRYSFNAPFIGTQVQKKSAGSPMAGLFFTSYNVSGNDTTILPAAFRSGFNSDDLFSNANFFSGGITAGYAYTLVLPARFFIMASLTPGLALNIGETISDSTHILGSPVTFSPKLITRNSIGYAGNIFYALLSYSLDINDIALNNKSQLIYTPEKIKMVLGYRIK